MTLEEAKKEISDPRYEVFSDESNDYTSGKSDALGKAPKVLDKVASESAGTPDTLTLMGLARELRKLFDFKYLTCDDYDQQIDFCIWQDKPYFTDHEWKTDPPRAMSLLIEPDLLIASVDLSEYADESGAIDYSRCIVEVLYDVD